MDLQTLTDDELRALVRFPAAEANRRKALIRLQGQPCRLDVAWMGTLLCLRVTPLEGWVHLVHENLVAEIERRWGFYHISLGHFNWETWTEEHAAALEMLAARWDGWHGVLAIGHVPEDVSKGYLEVVEPAVVACRHVSFFHERGGYADRDLHISA